MLVDIINPVSFDHLNALMEVETKAWPSDGDNTQATQEKIHHRIESFPQGITLALDSITRKPLGAQYSFRLNWDGNLKKLTSWDELTACGWTNKCHCPEGNTGFLVGVGVVPEARQQAVEHSLRWKEPMRISELLIAKTLDILLGLGAKSVIGNARIPCYHLRPELSVEEYCRLRREDKASFDPVLRFHKRMGAEILKPVPYSMEDPESRDAGCWVIYRQRFESYCLSK